MKKIVGAFGAAIFGVVLFIAAFPVLYLNESWTLTRTLGIAKAREDVIEVKADTIDPANDKKLVQFSGKAETSDIVTDEDFGVSENGIRLTRTVEMYQWEEEEEKPEKEDAKPTYSYHADWYSTRIDSNDFHRSGYDNPSMEYQSQTEYANHVNVGAFHLNQDLIDDIEKNEDVEVDLANVPGDLAAQLAVTPSGFYLPMSARNRTASAPSPSPESTPTPDPNNEDDDNSGNGNLCDDPAAEDAAAPAASDSAPETGSAPAEDAAPPTTNEPPETSEPPTTNEPPSTDEPPSGGVSVPSEPEIGDLRITFQVTRPGCDVSVISGQSGDTLTPYDTVPGANPQNDLRMGVMDSKKMLDLQQSESDTFTWLMRIGGFVMMFFGILLIMRPLTALAEMVPILGSIVGFGAFIIALLVAGALSLLTIAISWVAVRPLVGIPMVIVGVLLIGGAIYVMIKRSKQKPAEGAVEGK